MKIVSLTILSVAWVCIAGAADQTYWIGTWGASPAPQLSNPAQMFASNLLFSNQTIREIVHTSAGGNAVRVRLSNAYGNDSITIGAAHIALRDNKSAVVPASDRTLTFGGRPFATIPANAMVLSDPVKLEVPALSDVAISVFLPKPTAGAGIHYAAQQTSYIGQGDLTSAHHFLKHPRCLPGCLLRGLTSPLRSLQRPSLRLVIRLPMERIPLSMRTTGGRTYWPTALRAKRGTKS